MARRKGQWYLISTVIITGALLAISMILKSYFITGSASAVSNDIDTYFNSITSGLEKTLSSAPSSGISDNLDRFIDLAESNAAERGYLLDAKYVIVEPVSKKIWIRVSLLSDAANATVEGVLQP